MKRKGTPRPEWLIPTVELERELLWRRIVRGAVRISTLMHKADLLADLQARRHARLGELDRRIARRA